MRIQASLLLAAAGVAMASSSSLADFTRDITITAQYATTNNLGQPILGAGGAPLTSSVSHTFNIDTDFTSQGVDAQGTHWYQYSGTQTFGDLPVDQSINPGGVNNPAVTGIRIGIRHDPMVVANFNVAAGIVNTTFTVTSSLLSFPTITNGSAIASAALSVTDSATFGDRGQLSVTGLESGGNVFTSRFNSSTPFDFANLILGGSNSVPQGSTFVYSANNASFPLYDAVSGNVNDMQSEFKFTLSRFDRAAGTSTFEVIPAPATAVLLGLGGLTATRRRRTR